MAKKNVGEKPSMKYVIMSVAILMMMVAAIVCLIIAKPQDNKTVSTPNDVFAAKITYGSDIEDDAIETETEEEAGVTGIVTDVTYDPMDEDVSAPETDFMEMQLPSLGDVKADEYLGYGFWKMNYVNINEMVSEPVVSFYYSNTEVEPAGIYLYIPEEKMIVNPEKTDGVLFRGEARFNIDRPLTEGTQLILLVNLAYEGQDLGSCYGFAQEKEESEMSDEYFGSTYFTDDELMGGINSDDEPVAEEDTEDVVISE